MKKDYDPYRTDPLWEVDPDPSHGPSDDDGGDDDNGGHEGKSDRFYHRPECPIRDFAPPIPESSHTETSMLKSIWSFFIPSVNDSPEERERHRLILSLGVTALTIFAVGACGLLGAIGIYGFAYASDMKEIRADQMDVKVELLEQRIFETRIRQCNAATQESRQFYLEKLQDLLRKHQKTTASEYRLPLCSEVETAPSQ